MTDNKSGIAKRLKLAMIDKGVTQVEFSNMSNIPLQTIRNVMSRDTFTVKTAAKYADLLDCDIVLQDRKTGKIY